MTIVEMYENRPKKAWVYCIISLIIVGFIVWSGSVVEYNGIAAKGKEVAFGMVYGITHPDTNMLFSLSKDAVPYLMFETISIAILGTVFGAVLSIPVSFLCSEKIVGKYVSFVFRAIILLIRTVPSLVWALIWIGVTGPGPACGVITQSICSIGMISKMFTTAIDDLDKGVLESLDAAGCNTFEKIRVGLLPQLYANFISTTIYRFDINLKDASTLGVVGAGGIGAALIQAINSRRWAIVGAFLIALMILVIIIEFVSTKIRTKLARG